MNQAFAREAAQSSRRTYRTHLRNEQVDKLLRHIYNANAEGLIAERDGAMLQLARVTGAEWYRQRVGDI